MTREEILRIALAQSAVDGNCDPRDFTRGEPVVVRSRKNPGARVYLELPFCCDLVSYGTNVVASVCPQAEEIVRAFVSRLRPEQCFEAPAAMELNALLAPLGAGIRYMAKYYLPAGEISPAPCRYAVKELTPRQFAPHYLPEWSNALCAARRERDAAAVGAYDGDKLIGLAGCSEDCASMWQIGVDVLPEYRGRGIARALTTRLAALAFARGKVPFYCAAWSNVASERNALSSGFFPAWVQMTAKFSSEE